MGNLRDLRAMLTGVTQAAQGPSQLAEQAAASWALDEDAYFGNSRFTGGAAGRRPGRPASSSSSATTGSTAIRSWCASPPAERSVFVDRARERRIRPSVLVEHLRDVQRRPPRFRPEAFLESLFQAYSYLVRAPRPESARCGPHRAAGPSVRAHDVAAGAARDYSRQEFARDIYLLDRGGVTTTRRGYVVSFPASTGARSAGAAVRVVTEGGQEKVYYGIAFSPSR